MQRDQHFVELVALHVLRDEPAQARLGYQVVARAEESEQAGEWVDREDLAAP